MKYLSTFIIILFLSLPLNANNNGTIIYTFNNENLLETYFNNENIKFTKFEDYIFIDKCDLKYWLKLLSIFEKLITQIEINILNANERSNNDKSVYKRIFYILSNKNELIQNIDNSPPRLIYEPTNINSIAEGSKKGYVYSSNVNIVVELMELSNFIKIHNAIRNYIVKEYPNVIIGGNYELQLNDILRNIK